MSSRARTQKSVRKHLVLTLLYRWFCMPAISNPKSPATCCTRNAPLGQAPWLQLRKGQT